MSSTDGTRLAREKADMAGTDGLDVKQETQPVDNSAATDEKAAVEANAATAADAHAAAAQATYDAQKTGDPIGDADLRATLGVPTTPDEEDKLTEQQVLAMTSPSILQQERFEESTAALPGEATPGHAEALAKFQDDWAKATVDRDPAAYAAERAALGLTTTPEDLAAFAHPTFNDLLNAERQAQLTDVDVPADSALARQHDALQDQLNKAYIDRDPVAFVKARDAQGIATTPADLAAFNNPSAQDVLGIGRQDALLGITVPENSALAQQIGNVMQHQAPGFVTPTNTQGGDAAANAGSASSCIGTTQTTTGTGTGTSSVDRSDFSPTGTGTGAANEAPAPDHAPAAGGATSSATPTDAAGTGSEPSAIDAGLANLNSGTTSEPDRGVTSSHGDGSAGSTAGLSMDGGVGTQSGGGPAGGGRQITVDDSGKDMTHAGSPTRSSTPRSKGPNASPKPRPRVGRRGRNRRGRSWS
jgi:hypothetical protein